MITFAQPWYFLLLIAVPLFIWLYWYREKRPATFTLSSLGAFRGSKRSWRAVWHWLPFALLLLSYIFGVIALARPQSSTSHSTQKTEGINIMLVLDASGSMLARDFQPNRLEAAKKVSSEFVSSRPNDNIGLVVFAGESYTQCPLTTDQAVLLNLINSVQMGLVNDGTAIGDGLATAINRLREVEGESKVVILLTDGTNNQGAITPMTAADIAQSYGIKVYTIGVGTIGEAPSPVVNVFGDIEYQMMKVEFDEGVLRSIADKTGGKYFRATDNKSLLQIYEEIDQMEKVELDVQSFTQMHDHFPPYLWAALALSFLALLLRGTIFRRMP